MSIFISIMFLRKFISSLFQFLNQFFTLINKLYQIKNKISIMTTYKEKYEKYRLKKTQPIKPSHKNPPHNPTKQHTKTQKVNTIKTVPYQRKQIQDRYTTFPIHNFKEQNQNEQQPIKNTRKKVQNQNTHSKTHERAHSMSIVQKFTPSPSYQPLSYPKKGPIDNFDKMKLLSSVQNFFTRMIKPDNGCICDEPCEWAGKLFKWIDTPQFLVADHYQKLKQKVKSRAKKRKQTDLHYFDSIEGEQKDQQIQKSFKQIKKDIDRTQSESPTFQNQAFRYRLQNILKCYVMEDTKIGYVQGMNMILAGILYHVKDEARSYGIFRKLLYSIRTIYLDGFRESYLHVNRIQQLIKTHLFDVYVHLGSLEIELHMICLPWILSLLTSIVPLDAIHLIYYGFIKGKWNFIYQVCLSIFAYFKDKILFEHDASDVLVLFSAGQEQFKQIDWEDIVNYAEKISIQLNN